MTKKVYVVGHKNPDTDSICSAIVFARLLEKLKDQGLFLDKDYEIVPCAQGKPNPETEFVLERFNVEPPKDYDQDYDLLALVDHSDLTQAPDDLDGSKLLAVVDHHKIGDVTTPGPILFVSMPLGSTGTVLKLLYDLFNVSIDREEAGLMLASILSDTVVFRSATTTDLDKEIAKDLAKIANIDDIEAFGIEMKKKLSDVSGLSAREIILRDFKDFDMSGHKVGIGQVELVDLSDIEPRIDELLEELRTLKQDQGYHTIVLLLTDIIKQGSLALVVSDDESIFEKAFGKSLEDNRVWLDGVMSRKKQVVPPLQKAFEKL